MICLDLLYGFKEIFEDKYSELRPYHEPWDFRQVAVPEGLEFVCKCGWRVFFDARTWAMAGREELVDLLVEKILKGHFARELDLLRNIPLSEMTDWGWFSEDAT